MIKKCIFCETNLIRFCENYFVINCCLFSFASKSGKSYKDKSYYFQCFSLDGQAGSIIIMTHHFYSFPPYTHFLMQLLQCMQFGKSFCDCSMQGKPLYNG